MQNFLKKNIFSILHFFGGDIPNAACIFMYHSIGNNAALFTVPTESFKRQLNYLKEKKYEVVLLSELIARLEQGSSITNTVVLTFDDGYADNYENAFPLLKKYSFPATIFLTNAKIGFVSDDEEKGSLSFLSKQQILEMHSSGLVEFLPHGEHHTKLHTLTRNVATQEILDSFMHTSELVGNIPRIFAYPSGKFSDETVDILMQEKFRGAVTVNPGLVTPNSPILTLPRNHVDSKTSYAEFCARLSKAGEWYEKLKVWN